MGEISSTWIADDIIPWCTKLPWSDQFPTESQSLSADIGPAYLNLPTAGAARSQCQIIGLRPRRHSAAQGFLLVPLTLYETEQPELHTGLIAHSKVDGERRWIYDASADPHFFASIFKLQSGTLASLSFGTNIPLKLRAQSSSLDLAAQAWKSQDGHDLNLAVTDVQHSAEGTQIKVLSEESTYSLQMARHVTWESADSIDLRETTLFRIEAHWQIPGDKARQAVFIDAQRDYELSEASSSPLDPERSRP